MEKLIFLGWSLILIGVFTLIMYFETMVFYSLGLIFAGALLHIAAAVKSKSNLPILCRIGYHKYEIIGHDEELQSMRIYKCRRCGHEHKAMLGGGG